MAFTKRSKSSKLQSTKKTTFKRFGSSEKKERQPKEDKPWAVYNKRLGVVFARQTRNGACYAAQVDENEAEQVVRNIEKGREKSIFSKEFFHKPARDSR